MERMPSPDELIRPGAYVEAAIEAVPDIVDRTVRLMQCNPEPIPAQAQQLFCHRLASQAMFEYPDSKDAYENMAYFIKGMQWGYGLALCSVRYPQLHFSRHGLDMPSEDMMAMLRDNIRNYANESRELICALMGSLYTDIDPDVRYSNTVFWGFVSSLYMVDQAERNKIAQEREAFTARREQVEQAEFEMAFNEMADEAAWERKADETEAWYRIVEGLQGEGFWKDEL